MKGLGNTGVVLRQSTGGDYCLAELITSFNPRFPEFELCVWSGSSTASTGGGQWIKTPVHLPLPENLCGPNHFFQIDMAFPLSSSQICWVDLLMGILVCNLSAPQGPEFEFISLPVEHQLYLPENKRLQLNPEEFRSMCCVRSGAIKFVSLEVYSDKQVAAEQVTLKTCTLSPGFKTWEEGKSWSVGEIWASESFKKMELPHLMLTCPVLSMNEDEVIYANLNDIDYVDDVDEWGEIVGMDLVPKGHYRIEFDVLQNKVLKFWKSSTGDLSLLTPILLASDFSAHLQGPRTAT
ncbi:hypothetical protein QOZ80_4BG0341510 [Eleusine coracana subsp. coracana]|nr:hypothetical protein QOZ80_4BG0341510 [Eleusine coracana subsp. coracana]